MFVEEIYEAAVLLCGEETDRLKNFCAVAEYELLQKLRPGITAESCKNAWVSAASLLAVSMYESVKAGTDDLASYSAGSVSVTKKNSQNVHTAVEELRKQAATIMAPYTVDDAFAFIGVRG